MASPIITPMPVQTDTNYRPISRMAVNAATVKDDISERKKFIAPVTVPICARATEFCSETTLTGNVVPSPSANSDSTTSKPHSGSVVTVNIAPKIVAADVPAMATRL